MPWLQITFAAPPDRVASLVDALDISGALSVTVTGGDDTEQRLQAGLEETAWWRQNNVTALYPEDVDVAGVLAQLRSELRAEPPTPRVDVLPFSDAGAYDVLWERFPPGEPARGAPRR